MKNALLLSTLLLVVLGLVLSGARAQSNVAPNDLFKTIEALDTRLFDACKPL